MHEAEEETHLREQVASASRVLQHGDLITKHNCKQCSQTAQLKGSIEEHNATSGRFRNESKMNIVSNQITKQITKNIVTRHTFMWAEQLCIGKTGTLRMKDSFRGACQFHL